MMDAIDPEDRADLVRTDVHSSMYIEEIVNELTEIEDYNDIMYGWSKVLSMSDGDLASDNDTWKDWWEVQWLYQF